MSAMDKKDRLNRMARLVFNKGNIGQLRDGFNALMDLFGDVLELPFEHGTCFAHDDIMERLEKIDQKQWRPIRNMFILDPFYGYTKGNYSEDETTSPAKLMLDFIAVFDKINSELSSKLKAYDKMVTTLNKEKNEIENTLSMTDRLLREEKAYNSGERTELKTAQATIVYLEGVVKEKNEKIAELQREKNVQLWEREKERIFAEQEKRLVTMETELHEQKRLNESLNKRLTHVGENNKLLKLKQELAKGTFVTGPVKTSEELKRSAYLLEKDVMFLEDQLYSHQRTYATVICGLKTDLLIISDNLTDPLRGAETHKDFLHVCELVSLIYDALLAGDLIEAQKQLPPHYCYLPNEFKLKRIRRLSKAKPYLRGDDQDDYNLPPLRNHANMLDRVTGSTEQEVRNDASSSYNDDVKIVENPCLIDPIDRQINTTTCMRYFPHMSMDFVKDHWSRFQEFDVDGNECLDFSEVVKALTSMGLQFTAQQAEEAMRESDLNKDRTLDFYEYLTVADKLFSKKGRSELFHTGAAKENRKVIAKTCVLQ